MLFRMATIAGFFLANQFFDQTFSTKEFRAVERGAGYRTEVEFYGVQGSQAVRSRYRRQAVLRRWGDDMRAPASVSVSPLSMSRCD
jgi:hypothetical protein